MVLILTNLCKQLTTRSASIPYFRRAMSTRTERMKVLLESKLGTSHLDIINESHMHNVPKESETHFKIVVVSPQFDGVSRVKREQLVQGVLKEELDSGLHALSVVAKTPLEWEKMNSAVDPSPHCMGGFGK